MTERQPDDLYDALRDRLAGYGQEPPAPLWAAIRAQLPPTVAQPQLRRRRWAPAALLTLLLAVASGTGWYWWRPASPNRSSTGPQQAAVHRRSAATSAVTTTPPLTAPPAAGAARPPKSEPHGTRTTATVTPNTKFSKSGNKLASNILPGIAETTLAGAASGHSLPVSRIQPLIRPLAGRSAGGLRTRNYFPASTSRVETALSRQTRGLGLVNGEAADWQAIALRPTSPTNRDALARESTAKLLVSPNIYNKALINNTLSLNNRTNTSTSDAVAATVSTGSLVPRVVALLSPAGSLPALRLSSDTLPGTPAVAARRWAAEVLAGPALTYRQLGPKLGSGTMAATPAPIPNSAAYGNSKTADQLAQEERPSAGFGVHVQVRWALTGRWSLSAGLGYQEYASQTTANPATTGLPSNPRSSGQSQNSTSYTHRDTYHFLTTPVRLGYALGQASGRFRYGLLAGADAAWYLGGTSANPGYWAGDGTPYRPLNLSLSAGLDLRYRVAPRLEVLAQPMATHFLTSLPKGTTGLTPRYLSGAGALFGLSYGLR